MSAIKNPRAAKQKLTFTIAANTDWHILECTRLGASGILVHQLSRLDAGGTNGSLDMKLIDGSHSLSLVSADIAAIPQDDEVYNETGIALVNSATAGTSTNINGTVGDSTAYDRRYTDAAAYSEEENRILLAVKGDGVLVGTVHITLRAKDVA